VTAARAWLARLRPVERWLLGYVGFTSLVAVVRLGGHPAAGWVLGANLLILLLITLAGRPDLGRAGRVLREIYPLILLAAFYPAIDILNKFGAVPVYDAMVRGWEHRLFGGDVSLTWWQSSPSAFWSTVLHAVYFAYYPIVSAPALVFLIQGRLDAVRRAVLWLISAYLICYVVFVLVPVAGPYYEFPRPAPWFLDNWAARLVYGTLAGGSAYGAAFPSSHVAATWTAVAAAFAGSRLFGAILSVPAALLTVGVVYCQMHYAVDALAGVVLAALVVLGWLAWEGRRRRAP
jgi:membrane-associated phospholipid phosphatase